MKSCRRMRFPMILLSAAMIAASCVARPVVTKTDDQTHAVQNAAIRQQVVEHARTGDWLVIRGYHATDHLVTVATGIPISHVGVYNAESRQIIEAEGRGVHLSTLDDFIDKSYRLLVIRPRWQTVQNGELVWDKALEVVGRDYDFLGTIGFNYPSKYYCSELAVEIYSAWIRGKEKLPPVIKPGELYLYGAILYDSLPRDEM